MKVNIKEALRKVQKLWRYITFAVVLFTILFTFEGLRIRREIQKLGVEMKPFHDLLYMVLATAICYVIKEGTY